MDDSAPTTVPLDARPRRRLDLPSEHYEGEVIVVEPQTSTMHALTGVGPFLWERMDGETSVEALAGALCERYEVEADQALADVRAFVAELVAEGLVQI